MSRKVKFRVWFVESQVMYSWDDLINRIGISSSTFVETEIWKPMQYTGLKDKNGVEIYESDVVEASIYGDEKPQELTVEWRDGAFVIDYEDSEYDCVVIGLFVGSLKVIGHIHEGKQ